MNRLPHCAGCLLAILVTLACLAGRLLRILSPAAFLPRPDVPTLALFSLVALTAEHYLASPAGRPILPSALLAGAAFSLLPLCAGLPLPVSPWQRFLVGTAVFAVADGLYYALRQRMDSDSAPFAPAVHALGLYLACQSLLGFP